mgnify:CR=1 FL=1
MHYYRQMGTLCFGPIHIINHDILLIPIVNPDICHIMLNFDIFPI